MMGRAAHSRLKAQDCVVKGAGVQSEAYEDGEVAIELLQDDAYAVFDERYADVAVHMGGIIETSERTSPLARRRLHAQEGRRNLVARTECEWGGVSAAPDRVSIKDWHAALYVSGERQNRDISVDRTPKILACKFAVPVVERGDSDIKISPISATHPHRFNSFFASKGTANNLNQSMAKYDHPQVTRVAWIFLKQLYTPIVTICLFDELHCGRRLASPLNWDGAPSGVYSARQGHSHPMSPDE